MSTGKVQGIGIYRKISTLSVNIKSLGVIVDFYRLTYYGVGYVFRELCFWINKQPIISKVSRQKIYYFSD